MLLNKLGCCLETYPCDVGKSLIMVALALHHVRICLQLGRTLGGEGDKLQAMWSKAPTVHDALNL